MSMYAPVSAPVATTAAAPNVTTATATATASGTTTFLGTVGNANANGVYHLPNIPGSYQLKDVRVLTTTSPGAGVTVAQFVILNGTSTAATITPAGSGSLATATKTGPVVDAHGVVILASSPTYMSTGGEMLWNTIAVTTASGSSLGSYAVEFVYEDLFVS